MLLIDLLPEDRRPVERTPLPRLLTVIGGVLVCGVELAWIAALVIIEIPGASRDLRTEQDQIPQLKALRDEIQKLETEQSESERRKAVIRKLYKERMRWAPKLDAISDPTVLPERIWLRSLSVEEKRAGRKEAEKYLLIKGLARGESPRVRIEAINKFIMRLESNAQFFGDFEGNLSDSLWFERKTKLAQGVMVQLSPTEKVEPPKDAPDEAMSFEVLARLKPRAPVAPKETGP